MVLRNRVRLSLTQAQPRYLFSSDSQLSKNYVCGYLHKMSDGKWSKRSWHRRWFVLDRQQGILSYYRHNPANLISASPHGNIIHMDDNETEAAMPAPSTLCNQEQGRDDSSADAVPGQEARGPIDENAKDMANGSKQVAEVDQNGHHEKNQQNLLYMNKSHPWYRGEFDLNLDNVSLLFEKSLAKSAPTSYFFQVSTLSLQDIDSKRGVQYKLCADNEADYDLWTHAISTAINRKHTLAAPRDGAPVLSHQQLYRQRLLQEQQLRHDQEECSSSAVSTPTLSVGDLRSPKVNTGDVAPEKPVASPPKPKLPPIITHFPPPTPAHSNWRLEVTVDGTKQCMILGFVVNMIALKCLAPEHVVGKFFVCIAITVGYVLSIYNPVSRYGLQPGFGQERRRSGSTGLFHDDAGAHNGVNTAVLGTDVAHPGVLYGGIPVGGAAKKFSMGSSMTRTEMLESGRSTNVPHSWSTTRGETFAIRSIDYKKTKRKEASLPALFEFIGCDLIRTGGKVDLISQRVELPEEYADEKIFIINAQLPSYAPSVWGDASSNGPGFSLVLYWKIPKEVHEELKNPSTPALRLLKRFLNAGNDTSLTDRFKVIAQVTNQDECGITGMGKKLLASHNSTPVLTRPQHRIYHFNEGSTEIVVDIHAFSYIARRGIHLLLDKTSKLVIDIGFVLQGETEDELPEQILGCCRLDHADVQRAMDMPI
uniref:PH domain-containing protein n=1 Tax=Globisporangium ultimum (strain ATCC 200006 / CBS 805.95 / DAOM BR144) TaxID=431595 RepID=K3X2L6_GLOUD